MLERTPPKLTFTTFIGHAPIVTIVSTQLLRKRELGRLRSRRGRLRARKNKRDPESFYSVPLPLSVINELCAELRIDQSDGGTFNDQEWRSMLGLVIADVIKSAVGDKK
jgi:hypothetical protein